MFNKNTNFTKLFLYNFFYNCNNKTNFLEIEPIQNNIEDFVENINYYEYNQLLDKTSKKKLKLIYIDTY